MRHNGSSVALEPEQVESTQLAQQYETSLLSDQAVHDAADLSDGAAARSLAVERGAARVLLLVDGALSRAARTL